MSFRKAGWLAALAAVTVSLAAIAPAQAQQKQTLLNVSYDPTRELYRAIDDAFAKQYKDKAGVELTIRQSHGGSGRQARSVIDGLEADVVTLALAYDIDAIADRGLLPENWQARLPQNSSPTPPPSCSWCARAIPSRSGLGRPGQGRRAGHHPQPQDFRRRALELPGGLGLRAREERRQRDKAKAYVGELLKHVPVLDTGARGATTTFVERGVGDVLLAWENEAFLALEELGPDKFDIVVPSLSILAEPPVAVVDKIVDKKGTRRGPGLPGIPVHAGGAGNHRQELLPPHRQGRGGQVRKQVPQGQARQDRRQDLRRLAQGAEGSLQRWRHLRPDLPASEEMIS